MGCRTSVFNLSVRSGERHHTSRLLTLVGTGGSGTTRLALFVASEASDDFANRIYFVDLAPLSSPTLVAKAIASVLGMVENPNKSLLDTVKHVLAGQEMLLLIDNFEHVIEATLLVSELLAATPTLSLPPTEAVSIQNIINGDGALFVQRVQMMLPTLR